MSGPDPASWAPPRVGVRRAARTLMAVKWSLLRGGLRGSTQQRIQVALALVFSILLGLFGLAVFSSMGRSFRAGDQVIVVALPVLVLGIGLLAAAAGVEATIDVRNLATEPLTRTELGTASLAAALVGPAALLAGLSGLGIGLGFGVRGLGPIAVITGVVLAWWATLLLVSRTAATILGVLANGRFRHVAQTLAAFCSIGVWFAVQFATRALSRWDRASWVRLADVFAWTPPGQLGRAAATVDRPGTAAVHLVLGLSWLPLLWWLHSVMTERLAGAVPRAGAEARRIRTGAAGLRAGVLRFLPAGGAGEVAARTLRTKARTPREAVNTVVAVVLGVGALALGPVLSGVTDARIVLAAGLLHFAVLFEGTNSFGFDGPPLWMEVVAGADAGVLVRGKALASVLTMILPALGLVVVLAAVFDGWAWAPAGFLLAIGSVLLATGASVASAALAPFAVPDSPNPFAAGDTGQGCLAGGILAIDMIVLTVVSVPVALAVWWASTVSPALTAAVAVLGPVVGAAMLWVGITVARRTVGGHENELVAKVTPAR